MQNTRPFSPAIVALILIIAGACQTLTLAPFNYWLLGPISIILILWSTGLLSPTTTQARAAAWHGWIFGIGLFGSGASWVYVSINTYGHAPPILAGSLTILFTLGLALFTALNFWVYAKLRTVSPLINALLFTGIWILGDGFRTVFLTGFPWLFLGYGHLESPLSGWIPITGIYGITGIVVLSGALLSAILQTINEQNSIKTRGISITVILAFWLTGFFLHSIQWSKPALDPKGVEVRQSVALLQTNIPQELKWKASQRWKTLKLLEKMSSEQWDKDLIIWPETAVPQLYDLAQGFIKKIDAQAKQNSSSIISGIPYRHYDANTERQILHNSIMSLGDGSGIYHKQKLVPFGEYVPLQDILRGLIQFFDLPMSDFRTGPGTQDNLRAGHYVTSPFICYEVVYPDFVAERALNANYLLTISNDSWFGASIGPLQHLEMARFRAAENARYMIRGTNNGISAVIDERGNIVAQSEQFVKTTLESEFKIMLGRTPFSYTGSSPLFIICLLFCVYCFTRRQRA